LAEIAGELKRQERFSLQGNLLNDFKLICPVQPSREKHSASVVGQISDLTPRVSSE
jgi:hypothetical protein